MLFDDGGGPRVAGSTEFGLERGFEGCGGDGLGYDVAGWETFEVFQVVGEESWEGRREAGSRVTEAVELRHCAVVVEVLAYVWRVDEGGDAVFCELGRGADAGEEEKLEGAEGAAGEEGSGGQEDAGGSFEPSAGTVENNFGGHGLGADVDAIRL